MGECFGVGLVTAAGEDPRGIDLHSKVGGDRPTALLAVAQLMRGAASVNLAQNQLTPDESLQIAEGVRLSTLLQHLQLSNNRLAGVWFVGGAFEGEYTSTGIVAIADAVRTSPSLTRLDLSQNSLGVAYVGGVRVNSMRGIQALADAVRESKSLRRLSIAYNSIGPSGGKVIGDAAAASAALTSLDISGNLIGLKGSKAVCDAAVSNVAISHLDLRFK